jgi:imidazole glycerol-phosphate synthase subunit HisH
MLPLTLLDYQVGNIHSLKKCFERAGASVQVETDPARILSARALLLPGVGAFGKVAQQIAPIRRELRDRLEGGLPAFAVCIGMQILYESSDEGEGEGIGLLPGRVRRLRHARLPHIGWNSVEHDGRGPFAGISPSSHFYYVHSFAPSECGEGCSATTDYGGKFAAAAFTRNVWAVQFHPEKSSDVGFQLVKNFVAFAEARA